jgi:hypothetical protein
MDRPGPVVPVQRAVRHREELRLSQRSGNRQQHLSEKNERIEVLGMVLLISLLIWRLMERTMRRHIEQTNQTITGWDNRQTKRPTSFMMTTKFTNTLVLTVGKQRKLARPLRAEQLEFLAALKVSSEVFTSP